MKELSHLVYLVNYINPASTVISGQSYNTVICKIKPDAVGLTSILGIKYEVFNLGGVQYVDKNGNGLFFNHTNYEQISTKKEKINMNNIKISPEIPILELKVLNSEDENLLIYENQYYNFEMLFLNIGKYSVNEITMNVYAYKKDDYKVIVDEIKIGETGLIEENGKFKYFYKYLHKKSHKQLEFKIYYRTNANSYGLKPYLFYSKNLTTLKLLNIMDLKVTPVLSNNIIHELTLSDNSNFS